MVWFFFGILCCVVALVIIACFKMVSLNKAVKETYQQLDIASKNRAGVIDELIKAVKPVPEMDEHVLTALEELKKTPEDWEARVEREDQITRKLKAIFTVLRDHPEMQLDTAFEKLQKNVIQLEKNYRKSKNAYNDAVHSFYIFGDIIPFNLVRAAAEMPSPSYFSAKNGLSSAE